MNNGQKTGTNAVPTGVSLGTGFRTISTCPNVVPEKPERLIDTWLGQMSQLMSQLSQTQSTPLLPSVYRGEREECRPNCMKATNDVVGLSI